MMGVLLLVAAAGAAEPFAGSRFYLGDLHVHTGASRDGGSSDIGSCVASGACGALADLTAIARKNGLDFLAVTDHVNGNMAAGNADFQRVIDAVARGDDPASSFVTLLGAEVWFHVDGMGAVGHKTLLMFGDEGRVGTATLNDLQPAGSDAFKVATCGDIGSWMSTLESKFGPALLIPHHPALVRPMATDWSCHQDQYEVAVELYSRHGSSEAAGTTFDVPWSGADPTGDVAHALGPMGLRLGFVGGTDSHDTEPGAVCDLDAEHLEHPYGGGLTVVVLPDEDPFDRAAIYDAIRERRTYTTSGPLVPAIIDWSTGGARLGGMGEALVVEEGLDLEATVSVPALWDPFVRAVTLVGPDGERPLSRNGTGLWYVGIEAERVGDWSYAVLEIDGGAWYGSGACDDGGADETERVWLSPTWFQRVPPEVVEVDTDVALDSDVPDTDVPEDDEPEPPLTEEDLGPDGPGLEVMAPATAARCATAGGASGWIAGLVGILALRRRQRVAMAQPASL